MTDNLSIGVQEDREYESDDVDNPNVITSTSNRFISTMDLIQQPSTINTQPTEIINGWTPEYVNTLELWKRKIVKASYIYDYVMEKYKKRQEWLLILIAIMSGISTLLGTISSALIVQTNTDNITTSNNTITTSNTNTTPYYWVVFGLTTFTSICSAIAALLSYIIKLKQWEPYCQTISKCIDSIDDMYTVFDNQSIMPFADRENASTFIQKYNVEMINIINALPNISPSDYEEANNEYIRNAYSPTNVKADLKLN